MSQVWSKDNNFQVIDWIGTYDLWNTGQAFCLIVKPRGDSRKTRRLTGVSLSLFLVGHFQLFSTSKENVDTKNMVYKMTLNGDGGRQFSFEGVKYVHKDHFGETGLKDTTTLFVKIFRLGKEEPLGNATLYITAANFAKQLETMEIINTHSTCEELYWMARFGAFFAKTLWDVYSPVSSFDKYFDPDAPPRKKRPLRLHGCLPEVFNCTTEDKVCFCRFLGLVSEIFQKM